MSAIDRLNLNWKMEKGQNNLRIYTFNDSKKSEGGKGGETGRTKGQLARS